MFRVESTAGRLAEVRLVTPILDADIDKADVDMLALFERVKAPLIVAADYRKAHVLSTQQADDLTAMFKRHNDRIERSAILSSDQSATAVLQLMRVVREAKLPNRRAFKDPGDVEKWLGEILTGEERERLHAFLAP